MTRNSYAVGSEVQEANSAWTLIDGAHWLQVGEDGFIPELPDDKAIAASAQLWKLRGDELAARSNRVGLALKRSDDTRAIAVDPKRLALVALHVGDGDTDWALRVAGEIRAAYGHEVALRAIVDDDARVDRSRLRARFDGFGLPASGEATVDPAIAVQAASAIVRSSTRPALAAV